MTRNFANRIGYSIDHGMNGGVFNSLSQYILNKNNKWAGDGNLDFPSAVSPTTYTPGDGYTYVVMSSSSIFSVFDGAVTFDYMIVAGGGCNGAVPQPDAVGGGGANASSGMLTYKIDDADLVLTTAFGSVTLTTANFGFSLAQNSGNTGINVTLS